MGSNIRRDSEDPHRTRMCKYRSTRTLVSVTFSFFIGGLCLDRRFLIRFQDNFGPRTGGCFGLDHSRSWLVKENASNDSGTDICQQSLEHF